MSSGGEIWEKVNLKAVGVPHPSRQNGCKVAFTTRSRDGRGLLRGLEEEESPRVLALPGMDSLRKVIIRKCGMWEIKAERKTLSLTQGFPKPL
ncbi:hypothetical protein F2Q68_00043287 [Brassica cretica]|uniref:NB-ARC domain-containing protein n=1 Tax=Brassica cretica TaxID=69181 RepID=A0A8S9LIB5_BRACR|nr:hypothetical protein F2Q68_00043287 [Brassica cretica]